MKIKSLYLSFLFVGLFTMATANKPFPSKIYPKIVVSENDKEYPLKLAKLAIDIQVIGNIAVTTYTMVFMNTENRVLEGELEFPLAEGQTISRFAMEMNGLLRDAVVVEKAKGREIFEKIVRRGVDPGLIEQTKGNVFQSRVYPIPANGTKTILVSYEQELTNSENKSLYILPLQFEFNIEQFSLHIEVIGQPFSISSAQNEMTNLTFDKWNETYKAHAEFTNYCPDTKLVFEIPQSPQNNKVYVEKFDEPFDSSFFYIQMNPKPIIREKILPRSICLLWDASASASKKDIQKELDALEAYFRKINTVNVTLVTFRNQKDSSKNYSIKDGDCSKLIRYLQNIAYDGGTQLGDIDLNRYHCDEFILSTDGMSNFGDSEIKLSKTPVIVIHSNIISDYSYLRYIATTSGGRFIDLLKLPVQEAVNQLTSQEYHFISTQYLTPTISATYPSTPAPFDHSFTLCGKLKGKTGRVNLNFGVGRQILYSDTVDICVTDAKPTNLLKRIWAEKAIAELDMRYEKNKTTITALGKQYSIVTRNTSLIVLDRIDDYIDNEIVPPVEMQKEYFERLKNHYQTKNEEVVKPINEVANQFEQQKQWWNRDPKSFKRELEKKSRENQNRNSSQPSQQYSDGLVTQNQGTNPAGKITGHITSRNTNESIPGASIYVKNTSNSSRIGSISDMDGNYTITIPEGSTLVFSFIGYQTEEVTPGGNTIINVALAEDIVRLEEIVVVGYGTAVRNNADAVMVTSSQSETESLQSKGSVKASIILSAWDPQTPYLKTLKETSKSQLYNTYLQLKLNYENSPSFFLDVADYFKAVNEPELALRVLSNIAELKTSDHQLLRVLAHRLQQLGYNNLAVKIFRDVLALREEEPQSYRDLALALADNNQPQEAIDILYLLIGKKWDSRFSGIEGIAVGELNAIVAHSNKKLDLRKIDSRLLQNLPVNVRVVLNWDADNCDMDLWVTGPDGEKCFYQNKITQTGGKISNDFTGGYGPEEFLMKEALEGKYTIQVNYFGSHQQKVTGPTTIQVELYTNYGTNHQKKQEITMRLGESKEVVTVGSLLFKKSFR